MNTQRHSHRMSRCGDGRGNRDTIRRRRFMEVGCIATFEFKGLDIDLD